ncbi:C40 family peptidase [Marinobacter oulmenensis]|uniref:Lipoprotein Spr/probable lipoprotein NlpC n=1 Tax=Marinobacter oulmenensis TaxID=643747 RepID=A0A840U8H7_9GAMM|nr:C40 family peptidase [Marinobacter oulmenensis]MBB5321429.1 lipoprotein Spr/probable lipoprotein NlpC [Marinobacter oulmenensis]
MPFAIRNLTFLAAILLVLGGCAGNESLQQKQAQMQPLPPELTEAPGDTGRLWQVFERYRGAPYQYGGTSASGFDCSGFILTAYREGLGQHLPRTTSQMLARGSVVRPGDIQPGDVVFFRIAGKEQHAGIYMGNNRFIHASTSAGVTVSDINGYYWQGRLSSARRF